MKKYFLVAKLAIQDVLEYKLDFLMSTSKYSLMVLLMTIVWQAVEKDGHTGYFNASELTNYFLLSAMLYTLSNFHPWFIEEDIKLGYLSKYLVKPLSPTLYYLFFEAAKVFLETGMKMIVFLGILFLTGNLPSLTIDKVFLLLLYIPFVFLFSFQWLTLISILSFWITEAYSVRWAVTIFSRLLSGVLVPLTYFPDVLKQPLFYLPFQHLASTPIELLMGRISIDTFFTSFAILLFWLLALSIFKHWVWQKGIKSYEGVGL